MINGFYSCISASLDPHPVMGLANSTMSNPTMPHETNHFVSQNDGLLGSDLQEKLIRWRGAITPPPPPYPRKYDS